MRQRKAFNLLFLTLPALILSLIVVELSLRAAGHLYIRCFSAQKNDSRAYGGKTDILCIGDSFTWGTGAGENRGYPAVLRSMLGSLPVQLGVCNLGIAGETSSLVYKKLNGHINQYRPRLIVLMIGCNNWWNMQDSSFYLLSKGRSKISFKLDRMLSGTKLYKLVKLFALSLRKKTNSHAINAESLKLSHQAQQLFYSGEYKSSLDCSGKALAIDKNNYAAYLARACVEFVQGRQEEALRDTRYYLDKNLDYESSLMTLNMVGGHSSDPEQREKDFKKLESLIRGVEDHAKRSRLLEQLNAQREMFNNSAIFEEVLFYDIGKVIAAAKTENIKVILQTYPHRWELINDTIRKASVRYGVPLVDNQKIFEEKSREAGADSFFVTDGHCNEKGYELIARNIYNLMDKLNLNH